MLHHSIARAPLLLKPPHPSPPLSLTPLTYIHSPLLLLVLPSSSCEFVFQVLLVPLQQRFSSSKMFSLAVPPQPECYSVHVLSVECLQSLLPVLPPMSVCSVKAVPLGVFSSRVLPRDPLDPYRRFFECFSFRRYSPSVAPRC